MNEAFIIKQAIREMGLHDENIWIGSRPCEFSYTGLIDEVVIFNRRLIPAELNSLY